MKRLFLLITLCGFISQSLFADVIIPRRERKFDGLELYHSFSITNLAAFPEYEFFMMAPGKVYDGKTLPIQGDRLRIVHDSVYTRGVVYVFREGSESVDELCNAFMGGMSVEKKSKVVGKTDLIVIRSIAEGTIQFDVAAQRITYQNGKVKKGDSIGLIGETPRWIYLLLPVFSILILAAFWFWRRRISQTSHLGNAA